MARAIWSGAISFGLVNVPVKLFSAVSKKTVRFNQLDAERAARASSRSASARRRRGGPVRADREGLRDRAGPLRGDQPEELEALEPKKTRTIDIEDFVDLDEIDPLYYDHPYYLAARHRRGQGLPAAARRDGGRGKVAIARVVIRSKEYLVAIRPRDGVLAMETMLFADEVVPTRQLDE